MAFVGLGCDSDPDPGLDAAVDASVADGGATDAGQGNDAGNDAGPPSALYAVCGFTFTPEGPSGYVALVPDLEAGTEVDLSASLEVPGGVACASPPGSGKVFLGSAESQTIQRFAIDGDNALTLEDEVSFAGVGVAATANGRNPIHFLSDTRAYFFDGGNLQIVVWNPDEMTIGTPFSIEGIAQESLRPALNFVMRDGDRLVVSARHFREDMSAAVVSTAAIIDTTDDSVVYAEDERCGNLAWSATAANGDMYFASHPSQAARVRVGQAGDPASPPCMLRIRAGADDFDPDFFVELNGLTGDRPTGALLQGQGNTSFLLAYDETAVPITEDNQDQLVRLPAWTYWEVDLSGDLTSATEVASVPAGAGYGLGFVVDGEGTATPYVVSIAGDLSAGTFFDISNPGAFTEALTAPGFPGLAIRVR